MREAGARRAAIGTGVLVVAAAAVFAVAMQREPSEAPAATLAPGQRAEQRSAATAAGAGPSVAEPAVLGLGQRVYDEQGCASCHSIGGVGSPRSPLDGVGARLDADDIRLWIVDPQAMRPGIRKPSYPDLPPEQEDALVAFMQSLR